MQITVKVKSRRKNPAAAIRDVVDRTTPRLRKNTEVEEVFPGQHTGSRAGMVTVKVPDRYDHDCEVLLEALRTNADVEYAEPAAPRRPRKKSSSV